MPPFFRYSYPRDSAPPDSNYALYSALDPALSNGKLLTPGTSISIIVSGNTITINNIGGGGGGAPTNATYITQADETGTLPDSQPLEALATGLLKNTTGTGVLSIASAGTDYFPARTITSSDSSHISITNGNGVSGNPTIDVGNNVVLKNAANTWTTGSQDFSAASVVLPNNQSLPGSPTTTTQSPGDNTTKIATTAFVHAAILASYNQTVQNNGSALVQEGIINFAGSGNIGKDDSGNGRTTIFSVNPIEFGILGGGL